MEIQEYLRGEILSGDVVLMLGAGASAEARYSNGKRAPSGKELAELISDKFLGGQFKDSPLNQVSELAINHTSLVAVQEYIREIFETLEPTMAHLTMTRFNWYGITTTNYDRLVEKAYDLNSKNSPQKIIPMIDNTDLVDRKLKVSNAIRYLKLHGCITRTNSHDAPLILTTDQYVQYRKGRSRIFDQFKDWLYEHIVVFLGYGLQDPNLRAILLEIESEIKSRQRFYLVAPVVPDILKSFWESKRITVLQGTFEEFISSLDSTIKSPLELIPKPKTGTHLSIAERFVDSSIELNETTTNYFEDDVDYVSAIKASSGNNAKDFYKGVDLGWEPILREWDVRRGLADTILANNIIEKKDNVKGAIEFILIKAHAGAGKKTLLRRIAWDAAHEYNCLCLYLKQCGQLNSNAISNLLRAVKERVFLYIESVPEKSSDLLRFIKAFDNTEVPITIIGTARTNEWNMSCSDLSEYVTDEFNLRYLSHKDIEALLSLLERHRALGVLAKLNNQERINALTQRAGRQLLVALHEATLGKPFEEIIQDEYNNIRPIEAQKIYLTICVMNRFNILVRAGIISRIHDISFKDFKKRFFEPLEQIISTVENKKIKEYFYAARHSDIAEIIYSNVLRDQEERFDEFLKCLACLNISYETDRKVFYRMIRTSSLLDEFSDHRMIQQIFKTAWEKVGSHKELLHQMAIYEMKRDSGNLKEANRLLETAHDIAPNDYTIVHSFAELKLRLAEQTDKELERKHYLDQAKAICYDNSKHLDSYGIATLIKTELLRLEEILKKQEPESSDESEIQNIVKNVDSQLENGLQKYPGTHHLLDLEARLAKIVSDSQRLITALTKSFQINPRNSHVALWLAKCYKEKRDIGKAKGILENGLSAKDSKELHYAYAKLLLEDADNEKDALEYHFKRAYTPGDNNYDAQLLHARQLYINGDHEGSRAIFNILKRARLSFEDKIKPLYPLTDKFHGAITQLEADFGFITRDGVGDRIYFHQGDDKNGIFDKAILNDRVVFTIAFNMHGTKAIRVKLEREQLID